jgi:hypothetical protein
MSGTTGNEAAASEVIGVIPTGAIVPLPAGNPGNNVRVVVGSFFGGRDQVIFDTTI